MWRLIYYSHAGKRMSPRKSAHDLLIQTDYILPAFLTIHTFYEWILNRYKCFFAQLSHGSERYMQVLEYHPPEKETEIDELFCVVSNVIFGPKFDWDILEDGDERMVMKVTGCPLLKKAQENGRDLKELSCVCQNYCRSAVENLNPGYTQWYAKKMCAGDPYCENVIEAVR